MAEFDFCDNQMERVNQTEEVADQPKEKSRNEEAIGEVLAVLRQLKKETPESESTTRTLRPAKPTVSNASHNSAKRKRKKRPYMPSETSDHYSTLVKGMHIFCSQG